MSSTSRPQGGRAACQCVTKPVCSRYTIGPARYRSFRSGRRPRRPVRNVAGPPASALRGRCVVVTPLGTARYRFMLHSTLPTPHSPPLSASFCPERSAKMPPTVNTCVCPVYTIGILYVSFCISIQYPFCAIMYIFFVYLYIPRFYALFCAYMSERFSFSPYYWQ